MSCFPEWTYAVYLDGELGPDELRRLEAHLVGCQDCRRLVVDLREESRLLSDVLHEARPVASAVETPVAPARGMLFAMPITVAAVGAAATVVGVILETQIPAGASWLNPSRLLGVNQMLFDLAFAVRDRAPGLLEFGVAVAATASLAALVTFVASALLRKLDRPATLGLLAVLAWLGPAPAEAALDLRLGEESVRVEAGETLGGSLVVSGDSLRIDGVVEGNVLAFVDYVSVRGEVRGNVLTFAREVEVSGRVTGSVFAGSEIVRVPGVVEGYVTVGAERFTLEPEGRVGGDLATFGEAILVEGSVGRDLLGWLDRMELRGEVGRDVEIYADELLVLSSAHVRGDLRPHVKDPQVVDVDPGATIGGETHTEVIEFSHPAPLERFSTAGFYLWLLVNLTAAFVVGMLVYWLFPGVFRGSIPDGRAFFRSLGLGFAVAVLTPVLLVLVALTLVGLPAALLGFAAYLAALYLAGIRIAFLVGSSLTRHDSDSLREFGVALLVGLLVLAVAESIPFLGVLVQVVIVLVGLGLLGQQAMVVWGRRSASAV